MEKEREYKIGEVYMMEFDGVDNEQKGVRPGLVFQNNTGNMYSPNIIALPMTTSMKRLNQPTHVVINSKSSGLKRDSLVLCENPQRMSKSRIGTYLTTISEKDMQRVATANMLATSAIAFVNPESLLNIWQEASRLNMAA